MTVLEDPTTGTSLRHLLVTFVREQLAREDSMTSEKLVRLAHQTFYDDEWVTEQLVREGLNLLIPEIAARVKHELRQQAREGTGPYDTQRERIASVFEHVGSGNSKSVLAMTRPEHLFAAQEREAAAAGHLRWAGFHRAIAALHKNDTKTTGELPPAQVTKLWREHIEKTD